MKKTYWSGVAALLCISVLALVGCSAPSHVEQTPVATPNKVTPKITITQESPAESASRPASTAPPTDLASTERANAQDEGSCNTDNDCITIPEPQSACVPCLGQNTTQTAVSRSFARQIMGPLKDTCMPVLQQLQSQAGQGGQGGQQGRQGPQRSQDQSCQFNGAKCIQGTCQLANLSQQEIQQRQQAMGQGGGQQGGGPGSVGGNQSGFGGGNQGFGGGNQGGFGGGNQGFGGGSVDNGGSFGGQSGFGGGQGGGYGGNALPPSFGNPSSGFDRSGAYPGMNSAYGSSGFNSSSLFPQGYGRNGSYPGVNPRLGNFPGANRNFGNFGVNSPYGSSGFNSSSLYPQGYGRNGSYPGANGNFGNFPGMNPAMGNYPGMSARGGR